MDLIGPDELGDLAKLALGGIIRTAYLHTQITRT
jgi:hypothetical protein